MTSGTVDINGGTLNVKDQINIIDGTFTQSGGTNVVITMLLKVEVADKFSILAGTLNMTGGNLNLRGQSSSSYDAMHIPATGVQLIQQFSYNNCTTK